VYRVTIDQRSQQQIDALPADALAPFAEARAMLEVAPWSGDPLDDDTPDAAVRTVAIGPIHQVWSPT
jgi:hypothetical protein